MLQIIATKTTTDQGERYIVDSLIEWQIEGQHLIASSFFSQAILSRIQIRNGEWYPCRPWCCKKSHPADMGEPVGGALGRHPGHDENNSLRGTGFRVHL
jgi:hypothetical protein